MHSSIYYSICVICVPSRQHVSLLLDSTRMTLIRLIYADKACKISEDAHNLRHLRSITAARQIVK